MYKKHEIFDLPSKDTVIWRYMDFWKFKDLISTSKLYMPALYYLSDPNEGEVPKNIGKILIEQAKEKYGEAAAKGWERLVAPNENFKKTNFVSCWNIKEVESFALWKIYTKDKSAVAIKSTVQRLIESIEIEEEIQQHIGKVIYHDGNSYAIRGNMFDLLIRKWSYYDYENELRIVSMKGAKNDKALKTHPQGLRSNINLDILIEKVYVPAEAGEEDCNAVSEMLKENGLFKDVKYSGIRETR